MHLVSVGSDVVSLLASDTAMIFVDAYFTTKLLLGKSPVLPVSTLSVYTGKSHGNIRASV